MPNKLRVKIIDFGSSCFEDERVYTYIQSRFYRAPEVMLGLPYTTAIDMWSLGCILAELCTGLPLFPGESEVEQFGMIMEVCGVPPKCIIELANRKDIFFDKGDLPILIANEKGKIRVPGSRSLEQILKGNDRRFVDFIERCLEWNPGKRMTPEEALRHPWISGYQYNQVHKSTEVNKVNAWASPKNIVNISVNDNIRRVKSKGKAESSRKPLIIETDKNGRKFCVNEVTQKRISNSPIKKNMRIVMQGEMLKLTDIIKPRKIISSEVTPNFRYKRHYMNPLSELMPGAKRQPIRFQATRAQQSFFMGLGCKPQPKKLNISINYPIKPSTQIHLQENSLLAPLSQVNAKII